MLWVAAGSNSQLLALRVLSNLAVPGSAFSRYDRDAERSQASQEFASTCLPPTRLLPIPMLGRRFWVLKLGTPAHSPVSGSQPFESSSSMPGVLSVSPYTQRSP